MHKLYVISGLSLIFLAIAVGIQLVPKIQYDSCGIDLTYSIAVSLNAPRDSPCIATKTVSYGYPFIYKDRTYYSQNANDHKYISDDGASSDFKALRSDLRVSFCVFFVPFCLMILTWKLYENHRH